MSSKSRRRERRARARQALLAKPPLPEPTERTRPYPPTLALTSGTLAMLAGIAVITCPWIETYVVQALPSRAYRLTVLVMVVAAILAGVVFTARAMRPVFERLGTNRMRPTCFAEWLALAMLFAMMTGMTWHGASMVQDGLHTGVIQIPTRSTTKHYALQWQSPIKFWLSTAFYGFVAAVGVFGMGICFIGAWGRKGTDDTQ